MEISPASISSAIRPRREFFRVQMLSKMRNRRWHPRNAAKAIPVSPLAHIYSPLAALESCTIQVVLPRILRAALVLQAGRKHSSQNIFHSVDAPEYLFRKCQKEAPPRTSE